ncbi:MAG: hypothetical protein GC160_26815 [Acidobacteria bacterium]|nr:hypothetical protein [Acidobacteriota bacterium]
MTPALFPAPAPAAPGPIALGDRRELLIDDFLIERFEGDCRLRLHHPERREIALVHDEPWEGSGSGYHTIFQDGRLYRMYYKAWNHTYDAKAAHPLKIAYAESVDGIHWHKPDLGFFDYEGSRHNNIVIDQVHGGEPHDFNPFLDANPAARPQARYKAVGYGREPKGLYAFESADGLRWTEIGDGPILTTGKFDTQNTAFWDPNIGRYRAYIRDFDHDNRGIRMALSDDFVHWSEPVWLDYGDAPIEQLYTNGVRPYYRAPHLYIGFPARYVDRGWTEPTRRLPEQELRRQRGAVSERYGTAVTDSLLMTSRDGLRFHRWPEAFLRPGLRTRFNWSYGDNYLAWQAIETDSGFDDAPRELSLFATESYFTSGDARLRRYSLRIDGFASAFAPLGGGELVTKPLTFTGDRLLLNYATSAAGSIRVEVQDAAGSALPGFALADAVELFGDEVDGAFPWAAGPDLGSLAGRPVRLRFVLRDADLYSFHFAA